MVNNPDGSEGTAALDLAYGGESDAAEIPAGVSDSAEVTNGFEGRSIFGLLQDGAAKKTAIIKAQQEIEILRLEMIERFEIFVQKELKKHSVVEDVSEALKWCEFSLITQGKSRFLLIKNIGNIHVSEKNGALGSALRVFFVSEGFWTESYQADRKFDVKIPLSIFDSVTGVKGGRVSSAAKKTAITTLRPNVPATELPPFVVPKFGGAITKGVREGVSKVLPSHDK
ncbi:hypothetical protein M0P48_01820 [Candidatus Gracilibacteria bacterium]|nr:hypothetical protein [Candidatus Gracilibacteria bacterium]